MLYLLKKLKLYTKLGPERVHKAPIGIQIKIYLWTFVDYQHLQKYFYNWKITLNYSFIYKINIRGNSISKCPWSGHFLEGGPPPPPIQSLFSVFCIEIKVCIIFTKGTAFDSRTQYRSRICPAGSIKFPYFNNIIPPTLKKCKWLKNVCTGSANDHVLQSFKVIF